MRTEILRDIGAFDAIAPSWDALGRESAERCPTATHAWIAAWWEAFRPPGAKLHIVTVWRDGMLAAGLPLIREGRLLRSPVNSWVNRSVLLSRAGDAEAVSALVDALHAVPDGWDVLSLLQRPDDGASEAHLREAFGSRGFLVGVDKGLHSPYLLLPADWGGLLAQLSASFRQSLKRKMRAGERLAGVEMRICRDADVVAPVMEISLDTWQHANGTSMATRPEVRAFYEAVLRGAARDGSLYCGLLLRDGRPVAFDLNLRCGGTLHSFKLGYRQQDAEWSPGVVLKTFVLRRFMEEFGPRGEAREYDFMGATESYKLNWSRAVRAHHHLRIARPTPAQQLRFAWRYRLRPFLTRHARRFRALSRPPATGGG